MFLKDEILDHVASVADEPDLSGTKYRLLRALGRGGMGSVYAVEDTELGREVALKVSSGEHDARLSGEARVIAQLEHPGIVPVHDSGVLPDGRIYYVMKLVRGERLDRWAPGRDQRDLLRLYSRICEAVAFAHARGVLHRDLKPENIMIGEFGEALVMDWGIAKANAPAQRSEARAEPYSERDALADTLPSSRGDVTAAGTVMGTPAYMAPEQARGEIGALDRRTDVYALGSILYFVIAARAPFDGASAKEIIEKKLNADPPLLINVAKPLISIVNKAMARAPADRYASAVELSEDVRFFLDAMPVRAHRESVLEKIGRFASRHQVILSLLGVYLLMRLLIALAR